VRIDIVTIFPEFFSVLDVSLLGRARETGLLELGVHDLRDFTHDRHRTVDDTPYGGGAGMVMKPEPWGEAFDRILSPNSIVIFPSPAGERFTQRQARELSEAQHLVFACGRYEGIDQRFIDAHVDVQISLGDFVLSGGEIAALALLDAVARLQPGVLHDEGSHQFDSFNPRLDGLLDCPHYTRPEEWAGRRVPQTLLSGHHEQIERWRRDQRLELTARERPDLIEAARAAGRLDAQDEDFLARAP